jgi:hypothetical protein
MELGFVARALPHLERAQDQDPLVAINNGYLGHAYAIQGRWQEGSRLARRAMELNGMVFWTSWIAIGCRRWIGCGRTRASTSGCASRA